MLPYLAVLGAAGGSYEHDERTPATYPQPSTFLDRWVSLGLDLRSGDASLTLEALQIGDFDGARLTLTGRIVIDRRYDLAVSGSIIGDGAAGTASFAWYPTKDIGLSIAGEIDQADYERVLGSPTFSWWVAPRVELWASCSLVWVSWGQGTVPEWEPGVTLGITGRLRGR